jgi:hypothetical protein
MICEGKQQQWPINYFINGIHTPAHRGDSREFCSKSRALSKSTPSKDYAALQNKWTPGGTSRDADCAQPSPQPSARRMRDQTSRLGRSNGGTESFDRGNNPDLEGRTQAAAANAGGSRRPGGSPTAWTENCALLHAAI